MARGKKRINKTYYLMVSDRGEMVSIITLNRKYLPTFQEDSIPRDNLGTYDRAIINCSALVPCTDVAEMMQRLENECVDRTKQNVLDVRHECFYLYNDGTSEAGKLTIRTEVNKILKQYTNKTLEYFE